MARTMYDAVTVSAIPDGAVMVAGYVNGTYANLPGLRSRFPHALVVGISVTAAADDGQVLDVEAGDATPAQAPGWAVRRRAAGVDPTVYCNASTWAAVRAAFATAGVAAPHYWIADYDGTPAIPAGAVAKQYSNTPGWDVSAVADYWPGVDPTPPEADMPLTTADADLLLSTRIPEARLPNGYVPTVADCLNGTKTAGTQLTALAAQVGALTGVVSALAKAVGAAGGLTAEQAQAAAQAGAAAALAELGHALASSGPAATA